ncbi:MAG TPA: PorT family protein [Candidatus Prevotella avicola]|uniref:PorT family protein n=1 Tax=Candidatus Prevotella avicola TaxID=2838738 RepID=A0A9D2JVL9_9BACT|nr:PorT family protein [Candidatus Prevotella avicola]
MRRYILLSLLALCLFGQAQAQKLLENNTYYVRLGYNIGGTAPVGMPATIRSLSRYTLQPNLLIGADVHKRYGDSKWGLMLGIHLEQKDMEIDARVKNYHMAMVQGTQRIEGMFTGQVVTETGLGTVTIPVLATYDVTPNVRLKAGPYVSYAYQTEFSGDAYDGYIREKDPTGTKVMVGVGNSARGTYDFSESMRKLYFGIDVGADWYFSRRWGASLDLTWGLNGVFKSNFDVIDDTLYPIYANIGVTYKIK